MHDHLLLTCSGMNANLCLNVMAFLYGVYHYSVRAWLVVTGTGSTLYFKLWCFPVSYACYVYVICDSIHVKFTLMRMTLYLFCYGLLDIFYLFVWAQWWQKVLLRSCYFMESHGCCSTRQWSRSADCFLMFWIDIVPVVVKLFLYVCV